MSAVIKVDADGCPSQCPECGHQAEAFPVRVYAGEVILACPVCHVRVAGLTAILIADVTGRPVSP